MALVEILIEIYFYGVIAYFIVVNMSYTILLLLSYREILYYMRHNSFSDYRITVQSELTPPISILAPAYNEEATVVESVRSLLKLNYGKYEVIVINDGSKDATLDRLIREFSLLPSNQVYEPVLETKPVRDIYKSHKPANRNLVVVDKENGGKADALNAGINVAQFENVCAIDADSLLEDDALQKVMKPFLEDDHVVASGGIVRIANGCEVVNGRVTKVSLSRKFLPIFQVVEYFRAFLSGRMAWQGLNGLLIISGAFGMFRRDVVIEAGGYNHETVGEDMELVARIHRTKLEKKEPYRVVFVPDPVCWTEAPESLRILSRQRNRWHRGLLDTLLIHRKMLFNKNYGIVGMAAVPYFFFIELLGPVFEFLGYISMIAMLALGILNVNMTILFFIVALFYGVMFSVGAVLLEEISFQRYPRARDLAMLLSFGVLENFGYRQITLWWRMKAFYDYFVKGVKTWGPMQRTGFSRGAT
ncbi:MAG: glycosyltransferase family 2 protein [Ignavibacteriales bacterium]|nr:glycosyltransferase family 2 protein [Ignavibacteriales bacterium]